MKTPLKYLAFIIILLITNIGFSQTTYKIQKNEIINMKLKGTSTMHDWEMDAISATGEAQFIFKSADVNELASLKSLTFNLIVKDLKSDSKGLDKNAYKALKTDEFKNIHYILSSSTLLPEKGGYLLKTNGKLTVAGVTKDIEMDMHFVVNTNNTITCTGSYTLKMTDYNVDPPSFLMGIMKTGDDTTLDFSVTYIN
jgi:polyisoprenoid-binding protein YceI